MAPQSFFLHSLAVGILLSGVRSAPISSTTSAASASLSPASITSGSGMSKSKGYILLDWDTATPTSTIAIQAAGTIQSTSISSVLLQPTSMSNPLTSSQPPTASLGPSSGTSAMEVGAMAEVSPSKTHWAVPPQFSNMDPFSVTSYAAGQQNLAVLRGAPVRWSNSTNTTDGPRGGPSGTERWDMDFNALQILYPNGSINPGNRPQGGSEFYGQPLDLRAATNTTLQYSVYFPHDFDFVKGGKLPGLYGGHKSCSGGNAAEDCFSTRIMWRQGGKGELYLYVPKDKQTPALCSTPPKSVCDSEYGLSIGRGAWTFPQGDWTTIRQDIWLNTPGLNDGGFNIWINGDLVMTANDVRYRENAVSCGDKMDVSSFGSEPLNEDWSSFHAEDMELTSTAESSTSSASASIFKSSNIASITSSESTKSTSSPMVNSQSSSASAAAMVSTPSITSSTVVTTTSSYSFHAAHPTFQTPVRRWLKPFKRGESTSSSVSSAQPSAVPESGQSISSASADSSMAAPAPSDIKLKQSAFSVEDDIYEDPINAMSDTDDYGGLSSTTEETEAGTEATPGTCSVGFTGLFFSTFFGGHTPDWASPKDQYTYFKDFEMWVNN